MLQLLWIWTRMTLLFLKNNHYHFIFGFKKTLNENVLGQRTTLETIEFEKKTPSDQTIIEMHRLLCLHLRQSDMKIRSTLLNHFIHYNYLYFPKQIERRRNVIACSFSLDSIEWTRMCDDIFHFYPNTDIRMMRSIHWMVSSKHIWFHQSTSLNLFTLFISLMTVIISINQ